MKKCVKVSFPDCRATAEHSLGVERAAIMLAEKYGEDPEKAGTAGILHDITKYLSPQEQLNLCEKYGIILRTVEKA